MHFLKIVDYGIQIPATMQRTTTAALPTNVIPLNLLPLTEACQFKAPHCQSTSSKNQNT
jgi:hypothetical protein